MKQLGHLCDIQDCTKINIATSPFARSFTFGHTIRLSKSDRCDLSTLAHESFHVFQYNLFGFGEYLRRGVNDRMQEFTGPGSPYNNSFVDPNSLEGAAQAVGRHYSGKIAGCN
jgi:hypothetical protein